MLNELIDKKDNFELIRDQIAAILTLEVANQMQLAIDAGKNPDDWKLRVFTERSNPWEEYLDGGDISPLVNVWFSSSAFNGTSSNISERQHSETTFNIDCYGYGVASNDIGGGHNPGDREAAFELHKCVRLVRNILMAAENTYLKLRGVVWRRWPRSITEFQPQIDNRSVQNVIGARIALEVDFNELSPQVDESNTIEYLSILVKRLDSGEIVATANDGDLLTAGDGTTAGEYVTGEGSNVSVDIDFTT